MLASAAIQQPSPTSLCFCGGCSPRYIGWLPLRRGFKTPCVGVGVALGWPLANQQPPVAGHPRPTWSTSPNIHIDLVVLADRRANPLLSTLPPPPPSLSTRFNTPWSFSPCGPLTLDVQRSLEREREGGRGGEGERRSCLTSSVQRNFRK